MSDETFEEYCNLIQIHLDMSLQALAEIIDLEIEENPDRYFGIGIYEE